MRRRVPPGLALLAVALLAVACDPVWMLPGGRLSGEVAKALPADWSFTDEVETFQLETRPSAPYSVNVWGAAVGDRFYLASGRGGDAKWAQNIAADSKVRLRVGETIYELRAVHVDDPSERDRFIEALQRKYDWEPEGEEEEAWLLLLEPRDG